MTVRDRERKADLVMRVTTRRGRLRRLPRGLEEMAEMVMTVNHQKTLTFSREPYLMLRRSESPMFFSSSLLPSHSPPTTFFLDMMKISAPDPMPLTQTTSVLM